METSSENQGHGSNSRDGSNTFSYLLGEDEDEYEDGSLSDLPDFSQPPEADSEEKKDKKKKKKKIVRRQSHFSNANANEIVVPKVKPYFWDTGSLNPDHKMDHLPDEVDLLDQNIQLMTSKMLWADKDENLDIYEKLKSAPLRKCLEISTAGQGGKGKKAQTPGQTSRETPGQTSRQTPGQTSRQTGTQRSFTSYDNRKSSDGTSKYDTSTGKTSRETPGQTSRETPGQTSRQTPGLLQTGTQRSFTSYDNRKSSDGTSKYDTSTGEDDKKEDAAIVKDGSDNDNQDNDDNDDDDLYNDDDKLDERRISITKKFKKKLTLKGKAAAKKHKAALLQQKQLLQQQCSEVTKMVPGMNKTVIQTDDVLLMKNYIAQNGIMEIFQSMLSEILTHTPSQPLDHLIEFTHNVNLCRQKARDVAMETGLSSDITGQGKVFHDGNEAELPCVPITTPKTIVAAVAIKDVQDFIQGIYRDVQEKLFSN